MSLAPPAQAAEPPLVVAPFPKAVELSRERVLNALCHAIPCVPQGRVIKRGRVNYALARKIGVGAILTATTKTSAGNRRFITLTLRGVDRKIALQREFRAPDGVMLEEDLGSARDALLLELLPAGATSTTGTPAATKDLSERTVGSAISAEEAAAEEVPLIVEKERELLPEEVAAKRRAEEQALYSSVPETAPEPSQEEVVIDESRPGRILLDYGIDIFGRTFDWIELTRGDLLPFEAGFILAPRFGLAVQPFLFLPDPVKLPVSITLETSYRFALGLVTRTPGSTVGRATGLTQFDLGAAFGWSPEGTEHWVFSGVLGYRAGHFGVAPSPTGDRLSNIPRLGLRQVELGARLEYLFSNEARLEGGVSLLPVLYASDVISRDYFIGGGGTGFEATLGGYYPAHRIVDVGGRLTLTRVGLTLLNGEDRPFQAKGALEQHFGGSFFVRVRL